tara:strand:- start:3555 stop:4892 length:1338 start_codon:yes stop_codon:yes gene_type:complete
MSKILRRPLFRGGPVSSYGTGIASGLADGGRVGLYRSYPGTVGQAQENMKNKKFVTGGDIVENVNRYSYFDPNALPGFSKVTRATPIVGANVSADKGGQQIGDTDYRVERGYLSDVEGPVEKMSMEELIDYQIGEKGDVYQTGKSGLTKTVTGMDEQGNLITTTEDGKPREIKSVEDLTEDEKIKYRTSQMESAKGAASMESTLPGVIKINPNPEKVNPNNAQVIEPEESTTINADDVRAQAALFNELLSEGFEKDKKSAQISDASDYALKFFQSTVGEGKGMKEAAGDVAGFALAKPSRTEGVKADQKKTKQTATVMAINEALAQGKSDRELKKILGLADYKGNITLENAIALANHKDKKTSFFDNYKENRKTMGSAEAAIFTVQETFGKAPTVLTPEQIKKGVVVIDKENIGEYFIYPNGKITFVDAGEGDEVVEKVVLSIGG